MWYYYTTETSKITKIGLYIDSDYIKLSIIYTSCSRSTPAPDVDDAWFALQAAFEFSWQVRAVGGIGWADGEQLFTLKAMINFINFVIGLLLSINAMLWVSQLRSITIASWYRFNKPQGLYRHIYIFFSLQCSHIEFVRMQIWRKVLHTIMKYWRRNIWHCHFQCRRTYCRLIIFKLDVVVKLKWKRNCTTELLCA